MTSYELIQLTTQRPDTDGSFPFFSFSFRDERQIPVASAHSTFHNAHDNAPCPRQRVYVTYRTWGAWLML